MAPACLAEAVDCHGGLRRATAATVQRAANPAAASVGTEIRTDAPGAIQACMSVTSPNFLLNQPRNSSLSWQAIPVKLQHQILFSSPQEDRSPVQRWFCTGGQARCLFAQQYSFFAGDHSCIQRSKSMLQSKTCFVDNDGEVSSCHLLRVSSGQPRPECRQQNLCWASVQNTFHLAKPVSQSKVGLVEDSATQPEACKEQLAQVGHSFHVLPMASAQACLCPA
mmetsp:Transcript_9048/g.20281  ORF Transcript_9048/g.20281 Transcript_9048/m.20281 type:complete len:223 (+) Transcript_9048:17-685(+)